MTGHKIMTQEEQYLEHLMYHSSNHIDFYEL